VTSSESAPTSDDRATDDRATDDRATDEWGRVAEDGTVFVRTTEGERRVGQWPDGDPQEALALFKTRYAALAGEVGLLEQRVNAGSLSPQEACGALKQLRASVSQAQVVGDLQSLDHRLTALGGVVDQRREERKAERAKQVEEARSAKERLVAEAERLAESNDWRNGSNRMRDLLEQWKGLARLEKGADDALWRRFAAARTTYTRRRRAHFTELNDKREEARVAKERLVAEAESLSGFTEWGPTSGRYRELMTRWKAAGAARKEIDDELWGRFRAAQDSFFGARDAISSAAEAELSANARTKDALLVEAEALLPVTDLAKAKAAFRAISDRWDAAGKVPRERMKDLDARIRKVEQAIRGREDDQWRRSNPEGRARAADTVAKLETSIAQLEKERDKAARDGNSSRVEEHESAIRARRSWLAEAQRALDEFSG
jgi:hypothetical protein